MKIPFIAKLSLVLVLVLGACSPAVATTPTNLPNTPTAAPSSTPTTIPPAAITVAYVGGSLPCFAEPKISYNIITTVEITDHPAILGIDPSGLFWAVKPQGVLDSCWIEAQYVSTRQIQAGSQ